MMRLAPLLLLLTTLADAAPRGRIVRIERGSRATSPGFCLHDPDKDICIGGGEPHVGDSVSFVDETQRVSQVRISGYSRIDGCTGGWRMTFSSQAPDSSNSRVVGWYGVEVTEHGKMLNDRRGSGRIPNGYADEFMYFGLDREGDDKLDNAVSFFACDANAQFSQNSSEWCVSLWDVKGETFTRLDSLANLKGCSR